MGYFGVWVSGLPGQPIGVDWVVLGDGSVGLGSLWGHFGDVLGTCWGRFGDVLGILRCWDHFGAVLGHLEKFWGILGTF